MSHTDRQLLQRMHRGHEASARELWSRLAPRLLAYARTIAGSSAEDVVQAVFMAVLREPRSVIKTVEDPAAWLLTLTRRTGLNSLRAARREAARVQNAPAPRRPVLDTATMEDSVTRAVGALPRQMREVVVLRHVAGLTFDQLAVALGANRNTAAARYREAVRRLRLALSDSDGRIEHLLSAGTTP